MRDFPAEWQIDEETRVCGRCGEEVPEHWRHFQAPCRLCAVRSALARGLMAYIGLDGKPWLYEGARPGCVECDGLGWSPCQPQDLSVMRMSGPCTTCGAWAFELYDVASGGGLLEGSGRHYDDLANHDVKVGAAPLVKSLDETLTRESHQPDEDELEVAGA